MSDHDSLQSPTGSSGLIKGSADSYAHSRDQDAAGVIEHSGIPALTRASIVQSSSLSPLHHCCSVYSPSCRRKHDRHTTRRRCPSAAHTAGPVASSRPAADPRLRLIHLSPVLPSLSSWSPDSGFQSDLRRRGKTGRQTDGGTEEPAASSASTSSATEKRTAAARTGRKMRLQILAPLVLLLLLTGLESNVNARSLRLRRAFSYTANQTACVVDKKIYRDGDPIPTDDACESCKCRPPGFACVLRECEIKPGCRAIRREGECCPQYQCGCEHNGKFFNDGDRIPNAESPCYTCYCQGSSITCALADCQFRYDCEPEYVPEECCPRYDHCPPDPSAPHTTTSSYLTTLLSSSDGHTSPTPIFISSNPTAPHSPPTSSSSPDTTDDVTTMSWAIGSGSSGGGGGSPGAVAGAEKQAASETDIVAILPSAPDVTEPSSSSLNQTSNAEAIPAVVSVTMIPVPADSTEHRPAVREPVPDEVSITIAASEADSKPGNSLPENESPVTTTTESIDIAQDEYMTTKTWIPDHALPAEHRQQQFALNATTNSSQSHNAAAGSDRQPLPATTSPPVFPTVTPSLSSDKNWPSGSSPAEPAVGSISTALDFPDEIRISEPASDSILVPADSTPVTTSESNILATM